MGNDKKIPLSPAGDINYKEAIMKFPQKRIITALDVKDGRVFKSVNFANFRDAGDPVENAALYCKSGADEICLLDITATVEKRKNRSVCLPISENSLALVYWVMSPVTVKVPKAPLPLACMRRSGITSLSK